MYGLDAATGKILWRFGAGAAVNAAPSIVGDSVYWGCGYSRSGVEGSGCTSLFAFTLRPPGNVSCVNQVLTGLVQGNLTVPRGAWCDLTNNVHVTGNLQLQQLDRRPDRGRGDRREPAGERHLRHRRPVEPGHQPDLRPRP